jgi:hypothetical protein
VKIPDCEDMSWFDKQDGDEMDGDDSLKVEFVTTHRSKPTAPAATANKPAVEWDSSILGVSTFSLNSPSAMELLLLSIC